VHRLFSFVFKIIATFAMILFGSSLVVLAESPPIYQEEGVAINGYDPVAYIESVSAVKGSQEFSTEWMGVNWQFSTAENRDKFIANPNSYAPQYGGYCAYAVSQNGLAVTDPLAFTVHEGKLYLNYNQFVTRLWRQGMNRFIEKGDANWPKVLQTNSISN